MVLVGVVAAVGGLSSALCLRAARRSTGTARFSWATLGVGVAVWALVLEGSLLGWPSWLVWGVLRVVGVLLGGASIPLAPGVARSVREWAHLLLDGALVAFSTVVITLAVLEHAGTHVEPWHVQEPRALGWAVADLLAAAIIGGLAVRSGRRNLFGIVCITVSTLHSLAADVAWAFTGDARTGVVLWLVMISLVAAGSLSRYPDVWSEAGPDADRPRTLRWSHLVALPGLVAGLTLYEVNVTVIACSLALLMALSLQIVVLDRDNVLLWRRLARQASTDGLTGLLNRRGFLHRLEQRLYSGATTVLFVDLDGFKRVNDSEGHAVGDAVLGRVAHLMGEVAGPGDEVARLGGDEFAVLLATGRDAEAGALADRLGAAVHGDPQCRGVGVSLGIVSGQGGDAEALLRDADLAMYDAKLSGGRRHAVFEPGMRARVIERARIVSAIDDALQRPAGTGPLPDPSWPASVLEVDLQPIVRMPGGEWAHVEALIRWRDHGQRRPPSDFLPEVEESGLMVSLGTWVLDQSLAWLATWPDRSLGLSVNVAAAQMADPAFGVLVRDTLERYRVEPSRLTLEVTEQTAVDDLRRAGQVLQPLRALGIHVALDDFGTGFSSLSYLAQLPVDMLKIDRKFVSGLGVRTEDDALVRAVIGLATDLGLRTVAEGVETPEQARTLDRHGCHLAQGFLFARPIPSGTIADYLVANPPGVTAASVFAVAPLGTRGS